ncbi:MAG: AmmeMemoRadiSam system protein A, partial [Gammaproteobacteria bacterium]|nr:AmmeMemoRadiSam system protein A [Gammaproteobacteria bacterium]
MLETKHKQILLKLAAASVKYGLEHSSPLPVNLNEYENTLTEQGACFVTLTINDQLRGCIGTLVASRPLVQDLVENAYAAAFRDPRFPALTTEEYKHLHYHVSILNPPISMQFSSEGDLLAQLRPAVDG